MVIGFGSCTSSFFMCTIKEPYLADLANKLERDYQISIFGEDAAKKQAERKNSTGSGKDWKAWLHEGAFYVHGIVYMLVRIAVNVTMTM